MQPTCCPIEVLDLRLNSLGHRGVLGVLRALVRVEKVSELLISGTLFSDDTSDKIGLALKCNKSLKRLDISSNYFTEKGMDVSTFSFF